MSAATFAREEPSTPRLVLVALTGLLLLAAERTTPRLPWISSWISHSTPSFTLLPIVLVRATWLALAAVVARALGVRTERMGLVPVDSRRRREVAGITVGALVLGLGFSCLPSLRETYPLYPPARTSSAAFALSTAVFGVYAFTWELYFRGLWVFTLAGAGPSTRRTAAILIHAALFTVAHSEKPLVEMALAFPGALVAALYALRTHSMLAPFAAHVALAFGVNLGASIARSFA